MLSGDDCGNRTASAGHTLTAVPQLRVYILVTCKNEYFLGKPDVKVFLKLCLLNRKAEYGFAGMPNVPPQSYNQPEFAVFGL